MFHNENIDKCKLSPKAQLKQLILVCKSCLSLVIIIIFHCDQIATVTLIAKKGTNYE